MNIKIVENLNNLKNKEKLLEDQNLLNLIDLCLKKHLSIYDYLLIKDYFYLTSVNEYKNHFNDSKEFYTNINNSKIIYKLFKEWKPYEHYNLGELRGNFLELLFYTILNNFYSNTIFRESIIYLDDYKSHTWDIIMKYKKIYYLYECKFSSQSIKRSQINQMVGLNNRAKIFKMFLIFFESHDKIWDKLHELKYDTHFLKYNNMLKVFNIISLEDFADNNIFN